MLIELDITNFAIIDQLHLKFSPGFTVLTGETGAGKSIIVDALGLLLGGRAQSEFIRTGADSARVEGIFEINPVIEPLLQPLLDEYGLAPEGNMLIVAREIRAGRNVCRLNGRAIPLNALEQIGEKLVDIHGQSEHLSLLRPREHIDFLDRYGALWELRADLAKWVSDLRRTRKELKELQKSQREIAQRIDRLSYVIDEIKAAKLKPGEEETLKQERDLLANAEQRAGLADEAYRALYGEGEEQKGALDLVNEALQALLNLAKFDESLNVARDQAESVVANADDLSRTLRAYRDSIEFNPKRLERIEERLDLIFRLKRKYGDSVQEILKFGENAQTELTSIEHSEERIQALQKEEARLLEEVGARGKSLSTARRAAAERMAKEIEIELQDLGMERARFGVSIEYGEDPEGAPVDGTRLAFDSTGIDRVEFLVAPNPGEGLKPLAKIASGGETSRLMLALKAVLGAADRTPTLIFDEIDQGIGGRVGGVVGKKLWGLTGDANLNGSDNWQHQVICITHLPQIASYGDMHYNIHKQVEGDRTFTRVRDLADADRVNELAQMLGTMTDLTRSSAEEMLREAEGRKHRVAS